MRRALERERKRERSPEGKVCMHTTDGEISRAENLEGEMGKKGG